MGHILPRLKLRSSSSSTRSPDSPTSSHVTYIRSQTSSEPPEARNAKPHELKLNTYDQHRQIAKEMSVWEHRNGCEHQVNIPPNDLMSGSRIPSTVARNSETRQIDTSSVPTDYLQALNLSRVTEAPRSTSSANHGTAFLYAQIFNNLYSVQRNDSDFATDKNSNLQLIFPGREKFADSVSYVNMKNNHKYSLLPKERRNKEENKNKYGLNFYSNFSVDVGEKIKTQKMCKVCQKVYPDSNKLKMHMITHSNQKCFTCQVCNKCYTVYSSLRRHRKQHIKDSLKRTRIMNFKKGMVISRSMFNCKFCSKCFSTLSVLNLHLASHLPAKLFHCNICDKNYRHSKSLNRHKKLHESKISNRSTQKILNKSISQTNKAPDVLICKVCKKTFSRAANLICHMKIHSISQKFKCRFCGKLCFTSSELSEHSKIHYRSKTNVDKDKTVAVKTISWKCKFCSKTFLHLQSLTKHTAIHRVNPMFTCDICGNKYAVLSSLTRHKKFNHARSNHQNDKLKSSNPLPNNQPPKKKLIAKVEKKCLKTINNSKFSKHEMSSCCSTKSDSVPNSEKKSHKPLPTASKEIDNCVTTKFPLRQPVNLRKPNLDCKICGRSFKDYRIYFTHVKSHSTVSEAVYQCPVCYRKYQQRSVMKRHVKSQHKSFPLDKL